MGQSVLTAAFARRDGALYCEDVPAETIARLAGTPTFVYSAAVLRDRYSRLTAALSEIKHRVHYSLKANANRAILNVLRDLGSGADVVSGGELHRALRAGFAGHDIIFGGVGKTGRELREALQSGVKLINVESEAELFLLEAIARELGVVAPVGLRINPEVTVENPHEYIATGSRGHKFGIPHDEALEVAKIARGLEHLDLIGLDMHVGSQLSTLDPYRAGLERMRELTERLAATGTPVRYVDIGGGLPVAYDDGDPEPDLDQFARTIGPMVKGMNAELIVEPGRFFAAASGVLLARVLYRKRSGGKDYVIADAGMTELLRPSHYDAYHLIESASPTGERAVVDVVGPVCESGDFLARDREMDEVEPGDLLVIHTAGAYGYVMSSNYNARPKAAEVMVDGPQFAVVTARESYDDLVRLEQAHPGMEGCLMLVGLLSDTHDRIPAIAELLKRMTDRGVGMVLHAGDFCSPFSLKPFQDANVALAGVFGRNDGDPEGLKAFAEQGMGHELFESPHSLTIGEHKILLVHDIGDVTARSIKAHHVVVHGSEHQQSMKTRGDSLIINPGEACGWINGAPTAAVLDLDTKHVEFLKLSEPQWQF